LAKKQLKLFTNGGILMRCEETFLSLYKKLPDGVAFAPYRICPLGAHSDHQHGKITGFAIDKGIHVAYGIKRNGIVELTSLQFPSKRAQWHIASVPKEREGDWADYLRGATLVLSKKYPLNVGISGVIEGTLPIGGLSSSAAVILAFLRALTEANGITLTEREMIDIALMAENSYVGVACGKLDQSCEVFSRKDHLLYLDTLDDSYELIPTPKNMKPYKIAIFFSGVERNLAGSKFNMRVDECRAAAYALLAFEGSEYGKFSETYLRDVPYEVFLKHRDKLPESYRRRAEHFYTEFERVESGVAAWRRGDIEAFGKLSFESGRSSIYNWETGSPELKTLYEIMLHTDGIYGGRFSGAGFKGCCMALVDPAFSERITEQVTREYTKAFPALAEKFSVHVCQTADGVTL
jgi:galactokinase/galacturonokinase